MDIRAYAYGCDQIPIPNGNEDICEARENWDIDYRGPIALYDHIDKIVILNKDFDITTVHDQSVLFHELVHYLHLDMRSYQDKFKKLYSEKKEQTSNPNNPIAVNSTKSSI